MDYFLLKENDNYLTLSDSTVKYLNIDSPSANDFMEYGIEENLDNIKDEFNKYSIPMEKEREDSEGHIYTKAMDTLAYDNMNYIDIEDKNFLVKKGNKFYRYSEEWVEVLPEKTLENITKSDLDSYHIENPDQIPSEDWQGIGECQLVTWSYEDVSISINMQEGFLLTDVFNPLKAEAYTEGEPSEATVKAVPYPQVVLATMDVNFGDFHLIEEMKLYLATSGDGDIKIATSLDGGETFQNDSEEYININDIEDFKDKGMSVETFEDKFSDYSIENIDGMRNAYLISIEDTEDTAELYEMEVTTMTSGQMEKQMSDENIEFKVHGSVLTAKYKSAGNYVFNFLY